MITRTEAKATPPNSSLLLRVSYSLSLICQPDIRGHEAPHHHLCKSNTTLLTHDSPRVPGEIKRREVELDPQPTRDQEQGGEAALRKMDFFRFRLFLNSGATDIVFVTLPKHGS